MYFILLVKFIMLHVFPLVDKFFVFHCTVQLLEPEASSYGARHTGDV